MPRPLKGAVKGVAPGDGANRKASIVPLSSTKADADGREHKNGWEGPPARKAATASNASNGDHEIGAGAQEESGEVDDLSTSEGCVDCTAAYSFTCGSIENFCRCICPHNRHVPRVIYLAVVAIILVGFLIVLFFGVSCQVRSGEHDPIRAVLASSRGYLPS
jgi:hypothetical protein